MGRVVVWVARRKGGEDEDERESEVGLEGEVVGEGGNQERWEWRARMERSRSEGASSVEGRTCGGSEGGS